MAIDDWLSSTEGKGLASSSRPGRGREKERDRMSVQRKRTTKNGLTFRTVERHTPS